MRKEGVERERMGWNNEHNFQSGNPFSVEEAMLHDGCPPHDGQSAARKAVADSIRHSNAPRYMTALVRDLEDEFSYEFLFMGMIVLWRRC